MCFLWAPCSYPDLPRVDMFDVFSLSPRHTSVLCKIRAKSWTWGQRSLVFVMGSTWPEVPTAVITIKGRPTDLGFRGAISMIESGVFCNPARSSRRNELLINTQISLLHMSKTQSLHVPLRDFRVWGHEKYHVKSVYSSLRQELRILTAAQC